MMYRPDQVQRQFGLVHDVLGVPHKFKRVTKESLVEFGAFL